MYPIKRKRMDNQTHHDVQFFHAITICVFFQKLFEKKLQEQAIYI